MPITRIYFKNLEFRIYHEEDRLEVVDYAYKKVYRLIPDQAHDLPFTIMLERYLKE